MNNFNSNLNRSNEHFTQMLVDRTSIAPTQGGFTSRTSAVQLHQMNRPAGHQRRIHSVMHTEIPVKSRFNNNSNIVLMRSGLFPLRRLMGRFGIEPAVLSSGAVVIHYSQTQSVIGATLYDNGVFTPYHSEEDNPANPPTYDVSESARSYIRIDDKLDALQVMQVALSRYRALYMSRSDFDHLIGHGVVELLEEIVHKYRIVTDEFDTNAIILVRPQQTTNLDVEAELHSLRRVLQRATNKTEMLRISAEAHHAAHAQLSVEVNNNHIHHMRLSDQTIDGGVAQANIELRDVALVGMTAAFTAMTYKLYSLTRNMRKGLDAVSIATAMASKFHDAYNSVVQSMDCTNQSPSMKALIQIMFFVTSAYTAVQSDSIWTGLMHQAFAVWMYTIMFPGTSYGTALAMILTINTLARGMRGVINFVAPNGVTDGGVAQAGGFDALALLSSLFCLSMGMATPSDSTVRSLMDRLRNVTNVSKVFKDHLSVLKEFVVAIPDLAFTVLKEASPTMALTLCNRTPETMRKRLEDQLRAWHPVFSDLNKIDKIDATTVILGDREQRQRFISNYSDAVDIREIAHTEPKYVSTASYRLFDSTLKKLHALYQLALVTEGTPSRVLTPFCFWLYGVPGVGKSSLTGVIGKEIFGENYLPYSVDPTMDFWDRYNPSMNTVIYDDMNTAPEDADLISFFKIMTCNPVTLNMSAMEAGPTGGGKGTIFASPLVLVASNAAHPTKSTQGPEVGALMRRRNFCIAVELKKNADGSTMYDSTKNCIDWSKCTSEGLDKYDEALRFFEYPAGVRSAPVPNGTYYTIREVIDKIKTKLCEHVDNEIKVGRMVNAYVPSTQPIQPFRTTQPLETIAEAVAQSGVETTASTSSENSDDQDDDPCSFDNMMRDSEYTTFARVVSDPDLQPQDIPYDGGCCRVDITRATPTVLRRVTVSRTLERWKEGSIDSLGNVKVPSWTCLVHGVKQHFATPECILAPAARRGFVQRLCNFLPAPPRLAVVLGQRMWEGPGDPDWQRLKNDTVINKCMMLFEFLAKSAVITGIAAAVAYTISAVCSLMTKTVTSMCGVTSTAQYHRTINTTLRSTAAARMGVAQSEAQDSVLTNIKDNFGYVRAHKGFETHTTRAIILGGRTVLFPGHLTGFAKDGWSYEFYFRNLYTNNGSYDMVHVNDSTRSYRRLDTQTGRPLDFVTLELPARVRSFRDITNHFVEGDHFPQGVFPSRMYVPGSPLSGSTDGNYCGYSTLSATPVSYQVQNLTENHRVTIDHAISSDHFEGLPIKDTSSYCGSPLMTNFTTGDAKIIGFHVSRNGSASFSAYLDREMVQRILGEYPILEGETPSFSDEGFTRLAGDFTFKGYSGRSGQLINNEIKDSKLFSGLLAPPTRYPSIVNRKDQRFVKLLEKQRKIIDKTTLLKGGSPIANGVSKYGDIKSCEIDGEALRKATRTIRELLACQWRDAAFPIYTLKEAINGSTRGPGLGPILMNTSPGVPYKYTDTRRSLLIENIDGSYDAGPRLKKDVLDLIENLKKGVIPGDLLWYDFPKVELLKSEKIEKGTTRHVTCPPFHLFLVMRMYFGAVDTSVKKMGVQHGIAVGINPESTDWETIVQTLSAASEEPGDGSTHVQSYDGNSRVPAVVSLDYTAYDGNLPAEFIEQTLSLFAESYGNASVEEIRLRKALIYNIIHTTSLCDDLIYQKHQGNPSGCPLTTTLNSVANLLLIEYACQVVTQTPFMSTPSQFGYLSVPSVVYGDDNITTLPLRHKNLDLSLFAGALKAVGVILKADSGSFIPKPIDHPDVEFLKRRFVRDGVLHWKPQLRPGVIADIMNYTRSRNECEDLNKMESRINAALTFMHFYGEDAFRDLEDKIAKATPPRIYSLLSLPTYNQIGMRYLDGTIEPFSEGSFGFYEVAASSVGKWVDGGVAQGQAQSFTTNEVYNYGSNNATRVASTAAARQEEAITTDLDVPVDASALDAYTLGYGPYGGTRTFMGYNATTDHHFVGEVMGLRHQDFNPASVEDFNETEDIMNSQTWFKKRTRYATVKWNVNHTQGTILASGPLSPFQNWLKPGQKFSSMSPMEAVSRMFTFWRGDIDYEYQPVVSQYHGGEVFLGLHYGVYDVNAVDTWRLRDLTGQYGEATKLYEGNAVAAVAVEQKTPQRWMLSNLDMHNTTAGVPAADAPTYDHETCYGIWTLSVIMPLTAINSVATEVDVNLYYAGAPSFLVHYPNSGNYLQFDYPIRDYTVAHTDYDPYGVARPVDSGLAGQAGLACFGIKAVEDAGQIGIKNFSRSDPTYSPLDIVNVTYKKIEGKDAITLDLTNVNLDADEEYNTYLFINSGDDTNKIEGIEWHDAIGMVFDDFEGGADFATGSQLSAYRGKMHSTENTGRTALDITFSKLSTQNIIGSIYMFAKDVVPRYANAFWYPGGELSSTQRMIGNTVPYPALNFTNNWSSTNTPPNFGMREPDLTNGTINQTTIVSIEDVTDMKTVDVATPTKVIPGTHTDLPGEFATGTGYSIRDYYGGGSFHNNLSAATVTDVVPYGVVSTLNEPLLSTTSNRGSLAYWKHPFFAKHRGENFPNMDGGVAQSGAEGLDVSANYTGEVSNEVLEEKPITLGHTIHKRGMPVADDHFGTSTSDMRDCVRRFVDVTDVVSTTIKPGDSSTFTVRNALLGHPWINFFYATCRFQRGPVRFRIIAADIPFTGVCGIEVSADGRDFSDKHTGVKSVALANKYVGGQSNVMDFEIPYLSIYKSVYTPYGPPSNGPEYTPVIKITNYSTADIKPRIFVAAGDTWRPGVFMGVPSGNIAPITYTSSSAIDGGVAQSGNKDCDVDIIERGGVAIKDHRPAVESHMVNKDSDEMVRTHNLERPWSMPEVLSRMSYVQNFEWRTDQALGSEILRLAVPFDLITNKFTQMPFNFHRMFRFKHVRVRIQMNSLPMHAGQLNFYWQAGVPQNAWTSKYTNPNVSTTLNHLEFNACRATQGDLIIPWQSVMSYILLGDIGNSEDYRHFLGYIRGVVFNELSIGTGGSDSVTLVVWVSFEGGEPIIPNARDNI